MNMNPAETPKHDALYERATALVAGELLVEGAELPEKLSFHVRRRLQTALALFEDVLRMNPTHGAALLASARVHRRLGNLPEALDLLEAAQRRDPADARYAREAGLVEAQLARARQGSLTR
jgi:tetratricopeptide (TPR) repeat protein